MNEVLIISDDLTGACNSASYFIKNSCGIKVLLECTNITEETLNSLRNDEVVVLNTNTRTEEKKQVYLKIKKLSRLIPFLGKKLLIKKIDTAYRGNVAIELDAIIEVLDLKLCFIINSIPSMGRITVGGFQIINGKVLENTEFTDDPYDKIKTSFIPDILGKSLKRKIGLVSLQDIKKGLNYIQKKIKINVSKGNEILVFDSVTNSDIESIIFSAQKLYKSNIWEKILWVGSLALIEIFSNYLFKNSGITCDEKLNFSKNHQTSQLKSRLDTKKVLGISASIYEKTKQQIKKAEKLGFIKIMEIDISKFIKEVYFNKTYDNLNNQIIEINYDNIDFQNNLDNVIETIEFEFKEKNIFLIPKVKMKLKTKKIEKIILRILSIILEKLSHKIEIINEIERLILIGGETSFYILKALNTKTIQIKGKIEDGIDYGVILDGVLIGKEIVIKGGSVGNKDAVVKMILY